MLRIIELKSYRILTARALRRSLSLTAVALLASLVVSSVAHADPILYGSLSGATVDYTNITENSGTDPGLFPPNLPGLGLFGTPVVTGDNLNFTPINFFARSTMGAPPFDSTDGHLTFGVMAKPGKAITNINFSEGGGLSVGGIGTDATFVDVSAIGFVNVLEIDGSPAPGIIQIPIDLTFDFGVAGDGTWRRGTEGFANGKLWTGAQLIDINGWLAANNIPVTYGATKIQVALDNSLYATSEATAGAFIDKKDFGGLSVTVNAPNIPEPGTAMIALFGCLFAAATRRASRM
jgi:hypothetical protein